MKEINGGVVAPKGFKSAGIRAGIKPNQTNKDMAMVYTEKEAVVAGTFTKNKVKAAPVKWGQEVVYGGGNVNAVVINTGIANACTSTQGYENTKLTANKTAELLGVDINKVLICSTGVIGKQLPMDIILKGVEMLVPSLKDDPQSATNASEAILTTDTHKKEIAFEFEIDGKIVHIGGMCKGSGMIHPNMGTMLGIVTTDVNISKELLQSALSESVESSFNMISVDGDTSTNDTVFVLANGLAENEKIVEKNENYKIFYEMLHKVNVYLAKQIAGDGEGCTRLFEVEVLNAPTHNDAVLLSKSIITSNLTKAAVFGNDANWGRIFCAMGYSGADFDPEKTDIYIESEFGNLKIVENGLATDYDEEVATKILSGKPLRAIADVKIGKETAIAWGCDLTYEYVKINADYRS